MFRLGLTGSIGTGKSTTAGFFRAQGIPVHDADAAVHQLYAGAAVKPIAAAFPGTVRDDVVDRKALGEAIAGEPAKLRQLEAIVHPLVRDLEHAAMAAASRAGHRILVLDIPLLFETGAERRCDAILVTFVDPAEQRRRVFARPGMNEALFHAILARQMPQAEKCRRAHAILDTGRGLVAARADIAGLVRALAPVSR